MHWPIQLRIISDAEEVLRGRQWTLRQDRDSVRRLLALVLCFGMAYGAVMGTFGLLVFQSSDASRAWQMLYSAVKVPMLLTVTFVICVPSFFVVNTLAGLRHDFAESVRALIAAQAVIAIVLCGLAPLTLFWYLSDANYRHALLFNILAFAVASLTGQATLRRSYRRLVQRNSRHRKLLRIWILLYGFVGVQMGWVLRPFIGSADRPVEFFRPEAWDNAYLFVVELVLSGLFGM